MKFLVNKWPLLILLLSLTTNAFSHIESQDSQMFTIKGQIVNPRTSKVHFSSLIRCNSINGCSKFMVNVEELKNETKNNRDILISKQHQPFILRNIQADGNRELVFFFDALGRMAQVAIDPSSAVDGVINIGNVTLGETHLVHGQVEFPEYIKQTAQNKLYITFSYMNDNGGMDLVGFSQLNEQNSFNLKLLPGTYTVFFDISDKENNWRRVTKLVTVKNSDIDLGSTLISTSLDNLVTSQATLNEVLKNFDSNALSSKDVSVVDELRHNQDGVTLIYFFAGYCSPCLGDEGLSKYLKLAEEFPGRLGVLGIHSDSYRMTKNCPTSQTELMDFVQNKAPWGKIKSSYEHAKDLPVVLSFQSGSFAEELSINGYPSTMIFKDGVFKKWFAGSNPLVETSIREMLK